MSIRRYILTILFIFAVITSNQCVDPNAAGTGGVASCNPINGVDQSVDMGYEDFGEYGYETASIPVTIAKNTDGVDATSISFQEASVVPQLTKFVSKDEAGVTQKYATQALGVFFFNRIDNKCGKVLVLNELGMTIKIIDPQILNSHCSYNLVVDGVVIRPNDVYALVATDDDTVVDNIDVSAPVFLKLNPPTALINHYSFNAYITGVGSDVWGNELINFVDSGVQDLVEVQATPMSFMDIENTETGLVQSSVIFPVLDSNGDSALWSLPAVGGYPYHFVDTQMLSADIVSTPDQMFFFDMNDQIFQLDSDGTLTGLPISSNLEVPDFEIYPSGDYMLYSTRSTNPFTDRESAVLVVYFEETGEHVEAWLEDQQVNFLHFEFEFINHFTVVLCGRTVDDQWVMIRADLSGIIDGFEDTISNWSIIENGQMELWQPRFANDKIYYLCENEETQIINICAMEILDDTTSVAVSLPLSIVSFDISSDLNSYIVFQTANQAKIGGEGPAIGIYNLQTEEISFVTGGQAPTPSNADVDIIAYRHIPELGEGLQVGIINLNNDFVATPADLEIVDNEKYFSLGQHWVLGVRGGRMPYTFEKVSGPGTLNTSIGLFRATDEEGTAIIRVTDALGDEAYATMHVVGPGKYNVNYNTTGSRDYSPLEGKITAVEVTDNDRYVAAGVSEGDFFVATTEQYGEGESLFDDDGQTTIPVGVGHDAEARDVVMLQGNRVCASGVANSGADDDFAMIKLNIDGDLDGDFGSGGKVLTDFAEGDDGANAMLEQSDGSIILGGYAQVGANVNSALARYTADGDLDTTFGPLEDGKVVVAAAPGVLPDQITSMTLLDDDEFLTVGTAFIGGKQRIALMKFNADGTPDLGFGVGGKVITAIGTRDVT
ncbi:MAG TPA: delta-60 repeat domain-containing protein, partial [bacterium]|nr:delta-60 repeat domain-containing protein [bacterium]